MKSLSQQHLSLLIVGCIVSCISASFHLFSSSSEPDESSLERSALVTGLYVVDCATNKDLFELTEGMVIDMRLYSHTNLTIRAELDAGTSASQSTDNSVESSAYWVEFGIDNDMMVYIDRVEPYYAGGKDPDTGMLYPSTVFSGPKNAGKHAVQATPRRSYEDCQTLLPDEQGGQDSPPSQGYFGSFIGKLLGGIDKEDDVRRRQLSTHASELSFEKEVQVNEEDIRRRSNHRRRLAKRKLEELEVAGSLKVSFYVMYSDINTAEATAEAAAARSMPSNPMEYVYAEGDREAELVRNQMLESYLLPSDVTAYATSLSGVMNPPPQLLPSSPTPSYVVNQKLTLAFEGPDASETATSLRDVMPASGRRTTAFADFRTDLTISLIGGHAEESIVIPCHFGLSENPANNDDEMNTSGGIWYCHYRPSRPGTYEWSVSFVQGDGVAGNTSPQGDNVKSGSYFDGQVGSFTVAESDGTSVQAAGQLQVVTADTIHWTGIDDADKANFVPKPATYRNYGSQLLVPNLLDSTEFDNTKSKTTWSTSSQQRATWTSWKSSSELPPGTTWRQGRGSSIVQVIDNLTGPTYNANVFDVSSLSPASVVSPWVNVAHYGPLVYDVSKLEQWSIVMAYVTSKNAAIRFHLLSDDTVLAALMDSSSSSSATLSLPILVYLREMISRYSHHGGIIWDLDSLSSTSTYSSSISSVKIMTTPTFQQAIVEFIQSVDPYKNPIMLNGQYIV